jgi:SAM-dependent methyltransferase
MSAAGSLDHDRPQPLSRTETTCRSCGGPRLATFLDLGDTPLADRLVEPARAGEPEPRFPLRVAFCHDCAMVQVTETVAPEVLFADHYPYYSSFSPALLAHSRANVLARRAERPLGPDSLVVELASNDGYLLKNYVEQGVPVLGVDPAEGPARAAEAIGVRTLNAFFTEELGRRLAADGVRADIVHGNNVLAHVADTNGFVRGVASILKPDGVAVIEAPYVRPLIEHVEFDTIYHEHLCYFSVTALVALFARNGLHLNRVEPLTIHGGSLRLFVGHRPMDDGSVAAAVAAEMAIGMDRLEFFAGFSKRVGELRASLRSMIATLRSQGARLAAYGAAAKGATMLNVCGLDAGDIDFVVDRNVHKHGKLMPGAKIPILPPDALLERRPTHVLMLAWNFAAEILEQQAPFRHEGGRFIIPVPSPEIV